MSAAPKLEPLLVRPAEAARMIGFGRTKFYELIAAGEIRPIKRGAATLIEVAELRAWVERQKSQQ